MKKVVYSMLVLFIIGVVGTLVSVSASGGFSLDTYNVSDQAVITNKGISEIEMDLSSTDLALHPTTDDEITVDFNGKISKKLKNKITLDVKEKGNKLSIGLKGEDQIKLNIGVLIIDTKVDVYLPNRVYESLIIDNSSGDIELKDLNVKEISLKTSSGDMIIHNLASSENLFHTSSGEIQLTNIKGDLTAETSSGDIFIQSEKTYGDIKANTSSGDISIEFEENPKSLAINFNASSGDGEVSLDGVSYEEKSEHEIRGKIGSGEYELNAHTSSGDFYLK
ncbi:MAG TPA: DUF4097 family beta strand repeat-containing protein [Pseudoneobacillus sp.]|nr:DUF4097 family beta strand repeat-containing protein [Pseudoneobacillus sp.]